MERGTPPTGLHTRTADRVKSATTLPTAPCPF